MDREIFIVRPDDDKLEPPRPDGGVKTNFEDDKLFIHSSKVSKEHAVITIRGDEVYIKDLDSLNGVYVNGFRVKEAMLSCRDNVEIAKLYSISPMLLKDVFKKINPEADPKDYRKEFLELKNVCEKHEKDKRVCNRKHQMKINLLRILVVTVPAIAFMLWAKHPVPNPDFGVVEKAPKTVERIKDYFPIYLTISAVLPIFLNLFNLENKKAIFLDRNFKLKYRCPKCKRFLNQDWYTHRAEKKCSNEKCQAIWSD